MTTLTVLERVTRNAGLGLRFWDIATGSQSVDGLQVEIFRKANPNARTVANVNRSGIYVGHALPGLRGFEFLDEDPDALWLTATKPYRIEVSDPEGRFLPMAFDADLPAGGGFIRRAPWFSPPEAVVLPLTAGSPPQMMLEHVPLFSAPSRPVPEPLAVVYAQLRESGSARNLPWCLLGVSTDGITRGLGLSDDQGRVAVMFPYPEPQRVGLASPPQLRNDFGWDVELAAYGAAASPPQAPVPFADLAEVLAALSTPRAVVESIASPAPPTRLAYRRPLVARTAGTAGADASYLFVS